MTKSFGRPSLRSVFERALEQPARHRGAFLDEACRGHAALRAEVEALLAAYTEADPLENAVACAAASLLADAEPERIAGCRIGAYRIVREIGHGGMGRVFLAERANEQYTGLVAVKLLARAGSAAHEERFRTECQVLADLVHANIARLLDAGATDDGDPYLVMEYVDGEPIDVYCDRLGLAVEQRLALFVKLCDAVEHAHRKLVVHRDIKATNVLVSADGEPKLLDFGIAKLLDLDRARELDLHLTADVSRLMTPSSASPEQLRGDPVTTATDVYALGHLLYELLTGRTPYATPAGDRFALPRAILHDEPLRPSQAVRAADGERIAGRRTPTRDRLAKRLAGDLDTILLKTLRKQPEHRYATPRQLAEDVERHLDGRPVSARADSLGYVVRRYVARHRRSVAAAAAVFALVVALVGFYTVQLAVERDRARTEARRAEIVADFLAGLFEQATPAETRGADVTAREMLDRGAARIGTALSAEPAVQAALMRVIGSAYSQLGAYETAAETLEQALATRESLGGPDDAVLGDALHELGTTMLVRAQYDDATSLLERALVVRRRVHGDIHAKVSRTLLSLASVAMDLADFDAAGARIDEAEAVARVIDPPDRIVLADVLSERAQLEQELGDYGRAIAIQREVVDHRTESLGDDHPATLRARNNLADKLLVAGSTAEALPILRENLETRRRILPPGHRDIATALTNLAHALKVQGLPAEAEPLQAEALAIWRAAYPGDHPQTSLALNNLANLLHDLRNLDAALELHEEALAMNRRLYGDDHPSLATSYSNLASLLLDREDYTGALLMFRRTLDLDRRTLGGDHPYIGHDLIRIGVTLGLLGRLDVAEAELRDALAVTRRTSGEDHPQTFNAMRELGIVLRRRGRCDEAEPLIAEALPRLEQAFPGDPWQTAAARAHLGACLAAHDAAEGERLMRSGYERLVEVHGADSPLTRQARELLADFLRTAGRAGEAAIL